MVGGYFNTIGRQTRNSVARLNTDGKTDLAVFRDGTWYLQRLSQSKKTEATFKQRRLRLFTSFAARLLETEINRRSQIKISHESLVSS